MEALLNVETTLRDYLKILFRHRLIFITPFIVIFSTIYIRGQFETPYYTAQVKMLIAGRSEAGTDYYKDAYGKAGMMTHIDLVNSAHVIMRALNALKLEQRPLDYEKKYASPLKAAFIDHHVKKLNEEMKMMTDEQKRSFILDRVVQNVMGNISVGPIDETAIFTINVKDFNPADAARIANAISRSYVMFDLEQQAAELKLKYGEKHSTVIQLKNHIEEMGKILDGRILPVIDSIGPASVKIMQQAQYGAPVKQQLTSIYIVSIAVSFFLSIAFVFGLEYLDQSIKSQHDIEKFLKIPFLGSIPKTKNRSQFLPGRDYVKGSYYSESIHAISKQINLLMKGKKLKSLLITAADRGTDTSMVIADIATYLATKAELKVLIIDADLRTGAMAKVFKVADRPGLSEVLLGNSSLEDAVNDLNSHLYLLPAGDCLNNPVNLLESSMMSRLISSVIDKYEIVFLSSSDLKSFTDSSILSSLADATVIVINEGKVNRQVANRLISPLKNNSTHVIGAVLNNCSYDIPKIIYNLT